jgi:hypothetical protein
VAGLLVCNNFFPNKTTQYLRQNMEVLLNDETKSQYSETTDIRIPLKWANQYLHFNQGPDEHA